MWVICHACNRSFEVMPLDEWIGDSAYCAYCGHRHTADMCQASETISPSRRRAITDAQIAITLVEQMANLYLKTGEPDDVVIAHIHGWRSDQESVPITIGQLRAGKRAAAQLRRRA